MIDLDERERQAARLLLKWPLELQGVIIGGYAVAAYGNPRYSEDLDIVTSSTSEDGWAEWLRANGLGLERTYRSPTDSGPRVTASRWNRESVWVDLMAGGVRDRTTGAVVPEDWLLSGPRQMRLELISGRVESLVAVVRLEGLWATKLVAGRGQDIADLFAISRLPVALDQVRSLFTSLERRSLTRKFDDLLTSLSLRKTYVDALSRLGWGSPGLSTNLRRWDRFTEMVESAIGASESRIPSRPRERSDRGQVDST